VLYVRNYNTLLTKIKLILADKQVSSEEQHDEDKRFLAGSKKIIY
jgi:hypothetical protein